MSHNQKSSAQYETEIARTGLCQGQVVDNDAYKAHLKRTVEEALRLSR